MMENEQKIPNPPIYIPVDLVEDILLRLPLKPILKFKAVSKQWRSTLESKRFAEMRRSVQNNPRILAVEDRDLKGFQGGDAEIDIVFLQRSDATTTPHSMTCDGLVCIPMLDWVHVLNPSTGEFISFSSPLSLSCEIKSYPNPWSRFEVVPELWAMGFGKDEVTGNYKVVNMLFDSNNFEILDVDHIGEWRKLSPPPYKIRARKKSACVNGSIYWLDFRYRYQILALDLHTEEFRDLPVLPPKSLNPATAMLVNLEDRLAMTYYTCISHEDKLEIWSMDAQEKTWTRTYFITLSHRLLLPKVFGRWFTPIVVSKQGNLFLSDDSHRRLFKYYPETDRLSFVSLGRVITPFVENLVPLRR